MITSYFKNLKASSHRSRYLDYMKNKQEVLDLFVKELLGYAVDVFNRNVIKIDGEYFLMTLPFEPFAMEIDAMLEGNDSFSDPVNLKQFREPHLLMFRSGSSLFWSMFMSGDTTASVAFVSKDSCWNVAKVIPYHDGATGQFSLKRGGFGFRPMLIPLTRDMKVDRAFMNENATGSVVYGGSWSVNGKVFGAGDPAVVITPKHGVSIGDTHSDKKALQWVVWEGFLYCTQNLVMPSLADVHKRGFVFG